MISVSQIKEEILRLEESPVSFENCHRLATLYILRDHVSSQKSAGAARQEKENEPPKLGAVPSAGKIYVGASSSEFLRIIDGKDPDRVWPVLDELLETLKIVNPRLYAGVIRRLEE